MKVLLICLLLGMGLTFTLETGGKFSSDSSLSDVLLELGEHKPLHYSEKKSDTTLLRQGYEIITEGKTIGPDGKMSKLQSKHFKCTHCHNLVQEDPDLRVSDPEARLKYADQNNIPFLQGTTFYGMVNRETFYNDDYQVKYGSLVTPARDTLLNAVYLCTVQCSQGRALDEWETEAVMAYLNSLSFKLSDLRLSSGDIAKLNRYKKGGDNTDLIAWLKTFYLQKSPAKFVDPKFHEKGEEQKGDAVKGKMLYEHSCLHCHNHEGVTNYKLDFSILTFKDLKNNMYDHSMKSIFYAARKGSYSQPGYKPYMPNYTAERMSEQQMKDLMAYIYSQSTK